MASMEPPQRPAVPPPTPRTGPDLGVEPDKKPRARYNQSSVQTFSLTAAHTASIDSAHVLQPRRNGACNGASIENEGGNQDIMVPFTCHTNSGKGTSNFSGPINWENRSHPLPQHITTPQRTDHKRGNPGFTGRLHQGCNAHRAKNSTSSSR